MKLSSGLSNWKVAIGDKRCNFGLVRNLYVWTWKASLHQPQQSQNRVDKRLCYLFSAGCKMNSACSECYFLFIVVAKVSTDISLLRYYYSIWHGFLWCVIQIYALSQTVKFKHWSSIHAYKDKPLYSISCGLK